MRRVTSEGALRWGNGEGRGDWKCSVHSAVLLPRCLEQKWVGLPGRFWRNARTSSLSPQCDGAVAACRGCDRYITKEKGENNYPS